MNTANQPLVSIIIPVYNAEKYLAETINSTIAQTWQNKEIIIVDDGSTDGSLAIAKKYENNWIKVFTQENKGASAARNKGIKEANGFYIQFLDADDLLSLNKIESEVTVLNGSADYIALCKTIHFNNGEDCHKSIATNDWFCVDSDDPVDFLIKLYSGDDTMPGYGGMVQPNAWLTPRNLIEKAGLWNEFRCPDDDGEFFCRMVLASKGIKFSVTGLNYYRKYIHGNSLSAGNNFEAIENIIKSIDLKFKYLCERTTDPIVDRIFARHYWWTGVLAYPKFKGLSKYCIEKAKSLGYGGEKYVGGPTGHFLTNIVGWKATRLMAHYQQKIKGNGSKIQG